MAFKSCVSPLSPLALTLFKAPIAFLHYPHFSFLVPLESIFWPIAFSALKTASAFGL